MSEDVVGSVGISVSGCKDAEAFGFDDRAINRLTIRIAEFFLFKDLRVIFGHDWRENGVMRAVAELAETAASGRRGGGKPVPAMRMLNVVPTMGGPLSRLAVDAQGASGGVLQTVALRDLIDDEPSSTLPDFERRCWELWTLRCRLTDELNPGFRICLGGKVSGYGGYYAGVAEEAYFALLRNKPLYLIGGFGGATEAVCKALDRSLKQSDPSAKALRPPSNREIEICSSIACSSSIPSNGLDRYFSEFGTDKLAKTNGLSVEQNHALFAMTDIESALELIWQGARRACDLGHGF